MLACPKCGNIHLRRIHRNALEALLPFSKKYLCEDCYYILLALGKFILFRRRAFFF